MKKAERPVQLEEQQEQKGRDGAKHQHFHEFLGASTRLWLRLQAAPALSQPQPSSG